MADIKKPKDKSKYIEIKGPFHLRSPEAQQRVAQGITELAKKYPDAKFILREGASKNPRKANVYTQAFSTLSYLKEGKRIKVVQAQYGRGKGGSEAREAIIKSLEPFETAEFTFGGKRVTEDYDKWRDVDKALSQEKVFDPLRSRKNPKTGERYQVKKYPGKGTHATKKIDAYLDKVSEYGKTRGARPESVDAALEYIQDKADLFYEQQRTGTKRVLSWDRKTGKKVYNTKEPIQMITGDRSRRIAKLQKDYGTPPKLKGNVAVEQAKSTAKHQVPVNITEDPVFDRREKVHTLTHKTVSPGTDITGLKSKPNVSVTKSLVKTSEIRKIGTQLRLPLPETSSEAPKSKSTYLGLSPHDKLGLSPIPKKQFGITKTQPIEGHKKGEIITGLREADVDRSPKGIEIIDDSARNIDELSTLEGPPSPSPIEQATIEKVQAPLSAKHQPMSYSARQGAALRKEMDWYGEKHGQKKGSIEYAQTPGEPITQDTAKRKDFIQDFSQREDLKRANIDIGTPPLVTGKQGGKRVKVTETKVQGDKRSLFPTRGPLKTVSGKPITVKTKDMGNIKIDRTHPSNQLTSSLAPAVSKAQGVEFDADQAAFKKAQVEDIKVSDYEGIDLGEDRGSGAHYQVDKGDLNLGDDYSYLPDKDKALKKELAGIHPEQWANEITVSKKDLTVISGGQIGADRIGLEIGKELGFKTGGTAPPAFATDVGFDPSLKDYGVVEVSPRDQSEYAQRTGTRNKYGARTEQNVLKSDVTFLFTKPEHKDSPGSKLTRKLAIQHGKPLLENPTAQTVKKLAEGGIKMSTVNIAGNRQFDDRKAISNALTAFGETVSVEQQRQWVTKSTVGDTKATTKTTGISDVLQGDAIDPIADPRHGSTSLIRSSTSPHNVREAIPGVYKPDVTKDPYVDRPKKRDYAWQDRQQKLAAKGSTTWYGTDVDTKGNVYEKLVKKYPSDMPIEEQLEKEKVFAKKSGGSPQHQALMNYNKRRDAEIQKLSDSGELAYVSTRPGTETKKDIKPKTIRQQNYDANVEQLSLIRKSQKPGQDVTKQVQNLESNIKKSLRGEKRDTYIVTDEKGDKKRITGDISFTGEGSGPMITKSVKAPTTAVKQSDKARIARSIMRNTPKVVLGPALLAVTPWIASKQLKAKGIDKPTTGQVVQENISVFAGAPRVISGVGEKKGYLNVLKDYDTTSMKELGKRRVPQRHVTGTVTPFDKMKKAISGAVAAWANASRLSNEAMKAHGGWRFK